MSAASANFGYCDLDRFAATVLPEPLRGQDADDSNGYLRGGEHRRCQGRSSGNRDQRAFGVGNPKCN